MGFVTVRCQVLPFLPLPGFVFRLGSGHSGDQDIVAVTFSGDQDILSSSLIREHALFGLSSLMMLFSSVQFSLLVGWRPSLVGWRPFLLGWRPLLLGFLYFRFVIHSLYPSSEHCS